MNPRQIHKTPIVWTNNLSQSIFAGDFRNIGVTIVGTGTVQVLSSKDTNEIDFTLSSTLTNSYVAVVIADETVANTYTTSLTVSAATKVGEVNQNYAGWICLSRSANTVDAFVTTTDNQ